MLHHRAPAYRLSHSTLLMKTQQTATSNYNAVITHQQGNPGGVASNSQMMHTHTHFHPHSSAFPSPRREGTFVVLDGRRSSSQRAVISNHNKSNSLKALLRGVSKSVIDRMEVLGWCAAYWWRLFVRYSTNKNNSSLKVHTTFNALHVPRVSTWGHSSDL